MIKILVKVKCYSELSEESLDLYLQSIMRFLMILNDKKLNY